MPKSDWDYVNTSQDYELNDILSKHGYRETAANRKLIKDNLPPRPPTQSSRRRQSGGL